MRGWIWRLAAAILLAATAVSTPGAGRLGVDAAEIPSPSEVLGFDPVADGAVVDASQTLAYAEAVARVSPRVEIETYGVSVEGRPLWWLAISEPRHLREWGQPDGDAAGGTDALVALVTCGVHPDEVGSTPSALGLIERLVGSEETTPRRIRAGAVVLVVPTVSPDGTDRIATWLRDGSVPHARPPFLYHRYCGHDLNRDWLLGTQPEARALIERVHRRYRPWITVDLHQMGPHGARVFVPPYAEPVDPEVAPDLRDALGLLGDRVFGELLRRGHRGVARRWVYDAWTPARAWPLYHGGLRFLVEAASASYAAPRQVSAKELWVFGVGNLRTADHPVPWEGGTWTLRDSARVLSEAAEAALSGVLDDDVRARIERQRSRAMADARAVQVDARAADPAVVGELRGALELAGVSVAEASRQGVWTVFDSRDGAGWSRSLLLCSDYPVREAEAGSPVVVGRGTFNDVPYDTSAHDLALLAGVRARSMAIDRSGGLGELPRQSQPHDASGVGAWLIDGRDLEVFRHVADLIESGARVGRVVGETPVSRPATRPGDWLIEPLAGAWAERLVTSGTGIGIRAPERLDDETAARLRAETRIVDVVYPLVRVLRGPAPSKDEGWLRWVLEEWGARFSSISLEDVATGALVARGSRGGRGVLVIADGSLRRERPALRDSLERFVAAGGRVIAIGGAARRAAQSCDLSIRELPVDSKAVPGVLLRTKFARADVDPLLLGYRSPPTVLSDGGPFWFKTRGGASPQPVLLLDRDSPVACGLVRPAGVLSGRKLSPLVRLPSGERGGEWLLFGFRPHYRAWTTGSFRVLFNALLAP